MYLVDLFREQSEKMLDGGFYRLGAHDYVERDQWLLIEPGEFKSGFLDPLEQKLLAADVHVDAETVAPLLIVVRWRGVERLENLSINGKRIWISHPPLSTMVSVAPGEKVIERGVYVALGVRIAPLSSEITCRDQHLDHIRARDKYGVTADEAASLFFFVPEIFGRVLEQRKRVVLPGAYWYSNLILGGAGSQGLGIYAERDKSISAGGAYLDCEQPAIQVCEYESREFSNGESFSLMEATCDSRFVEDGAEEGGVSGCERRIT